MEIFETLFLIGVQDTRYFCTELAPIINLLKNLVNLLQIVIPIGLLVFGLLDIGKAVIAGKEDEMKKAQGALFKRVMYAVISFFVVTIVGFAIGLVGNDEWKSCWDNVGGIENTGVENDG